MLLPSPVLMLCLTSPACLLVSGKDEEKALKLGRSLQYTTVEDLAIKVGPTSTHTGPRRQHHDPS